MRPQPAVGCWLGPKENEPDYVDQADASVNDAGLGSPAIRLRPFVREVYPGCVQGMAPFDCTDREIDRAVPTDFVQTRKLGLC